MAGFAAASDGSRSLTIITGASRGFGSAFLQGLISSTVGRRAERNDILLIARDAEKLQQLRRAIQQAVDQQPDKPIHVYTHCMDLGDLDCLEEKVAALLSNQSTRENGVLPVNSHEYSDVLLLNNAGQTGDLDFIWRQSLQNIRQQLDLNVTSFAFLTSQVLATFMHASRCRSITIVNVSSISATGPYEAFGIYGAGKAARHMIIRTLALESDLYLNKEATVREPTGQEHSTRINKPHSITDVIQHGMNSSETTAHPTNGLGGHQNNQPAPSTIADDQARQASACIRALSYAPGPIDTDMQAAARVSQPPTLLRSKFEQAHQLGKLVDPHDSAARLLLVLAENSFGNGAHIDYYDLIQHQCIGRHPMEVVSECT